MAATDEHTQRKTTELDVIGGLLMVVALLVAMGCLLLMLIVTMKTEQMMNLAAQAHLVCKATRYGTTCQLRLGDE